MRTTRTTAAMILLLGSTGCVMVYGARVPAPGLLQPPAEPGDGEVALEVGLGSNVADGVEVAGDGSLGAVTAPTPSWPGADLALRLGLAEGVAAEARLDTSLLLPLPFPIPNGFSLAPVVRIAELGPGLRLHVMPRFALARAELQASAGATTRFETTGLGLDLPFILEWAAAKWFTGNVTGWARGFHLTGRRDYRPEDGEWSRGEDASWLSFACGATANGVLSLGPVRLGLQVGLEVGPNPGYGYCTDCTGVRPLTVAPQGALSLGFAWR